MIYTPLPMNKGNNKKFPDDLYTRNEWNLIRSRMKFGMIPVDIYPSKRQARKAGYYQKEK
jgi:hypothetical protein